MGFDLSADDFINDREPASLVQSRLTGEEVANTDAALLGLLQCEV
jgi:hypothetical protein